MTRRVKQPGYLICFLAVVPIFYIENRRPPIVKLLNYYFKVHCSFFTHTCDVSVQSHLPKFIKLITLSLALNYGGYIEISNTFIFSTYQLKDFLHSSPSNCDFANVSPRVFVSFPNLYCLNLGHF